MSSTWSPWQREQPRSLTFRGAAQEQRQEPQQGKQDHALAAAASHSLCTHSCAPVSACLLPAAPASPAAPPPAYKEVPAATGIHTRAGSLSSAGFPTANSIVPDLAPAFFPGTTTRDNSALGNSFWFFLSHVKDSV